MSQSSLERKFVKVIGDRWGFTKSSKTWHVSLGLVSIQNERGLRVNHYKTLCGKLLRESVSDETGLAQPGPHLCKACARKEVS